MVREANVVNDEIENLLQRLSPRGPDTLLREQIQSAVERELARPASKPWERRLTWAAAAALLLGIALNYAAIRADNERQARFGPPVPAAVQDVARMVETVSDPETGEWVTQQFQQAQRRSATSAPDSFDNNLHYIWQEIEHAQTDKDSQIPRPDHRLPGGAAVDRECLLGVANGHTAGRTAQQVADSRRACVVG
jgi:hypothetical protein